ncbi:MAG: hypothetical protein ACOZE5_09185 [Verrucomicrobiota bacterium]
MIAPGTPVKRPAVLERLLERRGSAFVRALADTCRAWPELGTWLCEEFGRDAEARVRFKALVAEPDSLAPDEDAEAAVSGTLTALRREKTRLLAELGPDVARLWGGRTWMELEQLVRRYQAGSLDVSVFMLARHWRKAGERARFTPELQRAGLELLDAVIRHGETRLWANLPRAVAILARMDKPTVRVAFGHADWWKVHALLYMMRRPQPAYRTRDVRAHLAKLGLPISSLDFRRFCNRHGIRRDMRAGRPRTRIPRD